MQVSTTDSNAHWLAKSAGKMAASGIGLMRLIGSDCIAAAQLTNTRLSRLLLLRLLPTSVLWSRDYFRARFFEQQRSTQCFELQGEVAAWDVS